MNLTISFWKQAFVHFNLFTALLSKSKTRFCSVMSRSSVNEKKLDHTVSWSVKPHRDPMNWSFPCAKYPKHKAKLDIACILYIIF